MKIITIFKIHFTSWLLLTLCVFVPYLAVRLYLPKVPYALYYYLIVLAAIKYILFEDKKYRNKLRPKLQSYLYKEFGRQASKQDIITRTESMLLTRDLSLIVFALIGIFVNIIL